MIRILLFLLILIMAACSSGDTGRLLESFPQTFRISDVNRLGITTYYYTDSIIYQTGNDLVNDLNESRNQQIDDLLFNGQDDLGNFAIQEISFVDEGNVSIQSFGTSSMAPYSELSGIGVTKLSDGSNFGFKINPDLNSMLSCYTIVNKRNIDSLFESQFVPELDTLYDRDSSFAFQLRIVDDPQFVISACDPYDVNDMLSQFALSNGIVNNDRIIVHRTDMIFTKQ